MGKPFILSLLCLFIAEISIAQPKRGSIVGQTMARWTSNGVEGSMGVGGVVVAAYTDRDTLYTTTVNGIFQFKKITAGRVTLRFSHISYKSVTKEIDVEAGKTAQVEVTLQEASNEMETVTVRGEVAVLKVKGDTLIYNAAAVRTLEGDETIRIVEQLPGVEASETKVSVMGVDISKTYVDGKLIFGSDPMAALHNLQASDVLKIRVYDEYVEQNLKHKRRKGDPTRRVFDIETKSKLIQAVTGHFLASYGADMHVDGRDNHARYGIGATANFFSESLLLSTNAFFNNINRKSNKIADIFAVKSPKTSYDRSTYANLGVERNWDVGKHSPLHLSGYYYYGNDYTRSENRTEQDYFPSSEYDSRLYADTTRNTQTNRLHRVDLRFGHPDVLFGDMQFEHHMQFEDKRSNGYHSYSSRVDNGTPAGGRTTKNGKTTGYDISDGLRWNIHGFYFEGNFDLSSNDGRGFRTDTLTSTTTRKEMRSTSDGLSRKLKAQIMRQIHLSEVKANSLLFTYSYLREKSQYKQTSLDLADAGGAAVDTINTYNFTNNYSTHRIDAALTLVFPAINGNLTITPSFSTTRINRDEQFPETECYDKHFSAFVPKVSFTYGNMLRRLMILYTAYTRLPSLEQLRPRLDDTNPYMLVAGNRNLEQSYTHDLNAQFSILFGRTNNNITVRLNMKNTNNGIAFKRIFYARETFLPDWSYTAPAQSTLTTYENVDGMWAVNADVKWIRPFPKMKSQLTLNAIFNYDDTPSFVDDALNRTKSYSPELKASLRVNVSRSFRFTLGARTSYIFSSNSVGQDDKYFQQGASANLELINIFKRFYLSGVYSLSYYKRFGGNSYDLNNQILNIVVGCKVLKRRGDISFTAYDILNRNSGYRTAMYSDYIQNTWTRSFGRYFTFNLAYKFNRSKSGVTNSQVKDGSVKE